METVTSSSPTSISSFNAESVAELAVSFCHKAKIHDVDGVTMAEMPDEFELEFTNRAEDEQEEEDGDGDGDDSFSFEFVEFGSSPISADDAFQDGQIRTTFPLFDTSLLFEGGDSTSNRDDLPHRHRPSVKKLFIEIDGSISPHRLSLSSENISGNNNGSSEPFNAWSGKAVEACPSICKKSNSTGFSKLWRFHNLLKRSNSDGKDAFVFIKGSSGSSSKKDHVKTGGKSEIIKVKATKSLIRKSEAIKAHEQYLRSKEDDRRKSYLPYRPKILGFFTNIHGGLSRNVRSPF